MNKIQKAIEVGKKSLQKEVRAVVSAEIAKLLKKHPRVIGFELFVNDECYNDEDYYSAFEFGRMIIETIDGLFVEDYLDYDEDEGYKGFVDDGGIAALKFQNDVRGLLCNEQEIIDVIGGANLVFKKGVLKYE